MTETNGRSVYQSEQIDELATALSKAQSEMKAAAKDSSNPFFGSKYADLASVWEACRKPLTANGLSVIQTPQTEFHGEPEIYTYQSKKGEDRSGVRVATTVRVMTRLCHASGQWIEGSASAMLPAADPQAVGSAITYLRRYALSAMVGVAPEDDDGEAAATTKVAKREPARPLGINEHGEYVIPGDAKKWDGHGGKHITDKTVPPKVLIAVRTWLDKQSIETPLITALNEELEQRRTDEGVP